MALATGPNDEEEEWQSLTELMSICTTAGQQGKMKCQSRDLIPVQQQQSSEWVIIKGWNPKHWGTQNSRLNVLHYILCLVLTLWKVDQKNLESF